MFCCPAQAATAPDTRFARIGYYCPRPSHSISFSFHADPRLEFLGRFFLEKTRKPNEQLQDTQICWSMIFEGLYYPILLILPVTTSVFLNRIFRAMNSLAAEAMKPSRSMNCSNRRGLDGFFHEAMAHGEFIDLPNLKMVIFYSKLLVYQKTLYYPGVRW